MPESFIPVWMSIGEAEEFRRFLQEEARSNEGEFPEREYSLIDGALEEERPRTYDQMKVEREARDILESIQGDAYLWQIDDSPWKTPEEVVERLRQTARDGLTKLDVASTQPVSESPGDSGVGLAESERTRLVDALRLLAITHFDHERLITDETFDCTDLFEEGWVRHVEIGQTGEKDCHLTAEGLEAIQEALGLPLAALSTQPVPGNSGGVEEGLLEAIRRDLHSESDESKSLAGPLGEAIADASGSYSLGFTTPEQVAEGICSWLRPPRRFSPDETLTGRELAEAAASTQPPSPQACPSCGSATPFKLLGECAEDGGACNPWHVESIEALGRECEECERGIYEEGSEWAPCQSCFPEVFPSSPQAEVQDCERCGGSGKLRHGRSRGIEDEYPCPDCTGKQSPAEPQEGEPVCVHSKTHFDCPGCCARNKRMAGRYLRERDEALKKIISAEPQGDVVEAAAAWLYGRVMEERNGSSDDWPESVFPEFREGWREQARDFIAAITPLLPGPPYALEVRERLEKVATKAEAKAAEAEHRLGFEQSAEERAFAKGLRSALAALDKEDSDV